MRCEPMSPSGITRLHCQVFGYSHLDKVTYLRPWFLPLFPYTHTYSVIEPSVDVIYVVLHTCNSVVVKPSPRIHWIDFNPLETCAARRTTKISTRFPYRKQILILYWNLYSIDLYLLHLDYLLNH